VITRPAAFNARNVPLHVADPRSFDEEVIEVEDRHESGRASVSGSTSLEMAQTAPATHARPFASDEAPLAPLPMERWGGAFGFCAAGAGAIVAMLAFLGCAFHAS
jgi:hypothetical protein